MVDTIKELEERLRQAQFSNDVAALDELLADRLQFVFLDGSVARKSDDITVHRNKLVRFHSIEFSEQTIEILSDVLATVTVKAAIAATSGSESFRRTCRYGRTW